jgi:hypothetical protein
LAPTSRASIGRLHDHEREPRATKQIQLSANSESTIRQRLAFFVMHVHGFYPKDELCAVVGPRFSDAQFLAIRSADGEISEPHPMIVYSAQYAVRRVCPRPNFIRRDWVLNS